MSSLVCHKKEGLMCLLLSCSIGKSIWSSWFLGLCGGGGWGAVECGQRTVARYYLCTPLIDSFNFIEVFVCGLCLFGGFSEFGAASLVWWFLERLLFIYFKLKSGRKIFLGIVE